MNTYYKNEKDDSVSQILSLAKDGTSKFIIDSSIVKSILRYIRKDHINDLYEMIGNRIPFISISLLEDVIEIKIKKTSMKKQYNFEHDLSFYYPIFQEIFNEFSEKYMDLILSAYNDRILDVECDRLQESDIIEFTALSYNIVPILDNIINVYI